MIYISMYQEMFVVLYMFLHNEKYLLSLYTISYNGNISSYIINKCCY